MFSLLAHWDTMPCPKLMWILPCKFGVSQIRRWIQQKKPFKCKWNLFFVCGKTFRVANPNTPMNLELDVQSLKRFAPFFMASFVSLRIAGSSTASGLPLPKGSKSLNDAIIEYKAMLLDAMRDETSNAELSMFEELANFLDDKPRRKEWLTREQLLQIQRLTGSSYELFGLEAMKQGDRWKPLMEIEVVRSFPMWVVVDTSPAAFANVTKTPPPRSPWFKWW